VRSKRQPPAEQGVLPAPERFMDQPQDFNRNWSPVFSTLWDNSGSISFKTAGTLACFSRF
jgi:hypothetical protein